MKIIQIVPSLTYGDAVGNDVLALNKLLHNLGIETKIYAIGIGNRIPVGVAESFYDMPVPKKDDMIIYHLATGCKPIRDYLLRHDCRKVMIYHNITGGVGYCQLGHLGEETLFLNPHACRRGTPGCATRRTPRCRRRSPAQ